MTGVLILDKPADFTSFDAVAVCRRLCHERKIGHTGTLDPMATGVLPLLLGKATRAASLLEDTDKEYEAGFRLGIATDTEDSTGKVVGTSETPVSREVLESLLPKFRGEILQVPPMYSAVSKDGKRLYELARKGIEVERDARPVTIFQLELTEYDEVSREGKLTVSCSKGTYIRTLCHDIGEKLGCGGCMEELLRSRVGRYSLSESHTLAQVEAAVADGTVQDMIDPVEAVLAEYPALYADSYGDRLLANGNPLSDNLVSPQHKEGWVRMYASDGTFTGIFQWDAGEKKYYPVKMF